MEKLLSSIDIQSLINTQVIPWGKNIALAIVIFIVGRFVIKIIQKLVMKGVERTVKDEMLLNFISSIFGAVLLLFVIIASLSQLGVDTSSLIALIGAAGLAIGLSLQDSLKNFAAGVMILIFKMFRKGDYVEVSSSKEAGTVEDISIFTMTIKTPDNKEVIIPNGSVLSAPIVNYSKMPTRRVDLSIGIGYDDDIKLAKEVMQSILDADERILAEPKPLIAVAELGDNSVNFTVRPWVNTPDYWPVYFDMQEKIKIAFDESGISIPYPQMDVHLKKS